MPDTNTTDTPIKTIAPIDELFESGDTPMILPEQTPQVAHQVTPQVEAATPAPDAPPEAVASPVEAPAAEVAQSPIPTEVPVETPVIPPPAAPVIEELIAAPVIEPVIAPSVDTAESTIVPTLSLSTGDSGSVCGVITNYSPVVEVYIIYRTMQGRQDAPAIRTPLYNSINFEQTYLASGTPYQFQASAVVNGIEGELSAPVEITPA